MNPIGFLIFFSLISNQLFSQYNFYTDDGNLYAQRVIETADEGYFIAAAEYCYTPGTTVIEGCTYAIHLVKTDIEGDTMWTNTISYYTQYGPGINVFENNDGSFTVIAITNQTYICDGIGVNVIKLKYKKIK